MWIVRIIIGSLLIYTHSGPLVTVVNVEHLAIEGDINAEVEVLPVPKVTKVILREPLSLDQLPLGDPTVVHHRLHHRDGVILKVVEDAHFPHSKVFIG